MHTEIALPPTLAGMCAERDAAHAAIDAVYAAAEKAAAAAAMIERYAMPHGVSPKIAIDEAKKEIDRFCWQKAFRLGGFDKVWDSVAKQEFENSLKSKVPEFNDGNLRSTLLEYLPQQEMMFKRGAVTMLRRLSKGYKSNAEARFKVGRRSIVTVWAEKSWSKPGAMQISYARQSEVSDLLRIVSVISGVDFDAGQAIAGVNASWHLAGRYDAYGLSLVPFTNGNVHVYMSEQLLDRVNGLIADFYGAKTLG